MSTQPSNWTASPAGVSIQENSHVARIKRVYKVVPVGTSVAASNDRLYQAPKETAAALDAWARRAAAANGFGDAPTAGKPPRDSVPTSLPSGLGKRLTPASGKSLPRWRRPLLRSCV